MDFERWGAQKTTVAGKQQNAKGGKDLKKWEDGASGYASSNPV
jgi:hypothetical protein